MTRKSLKISGQILLLGLLLGISSTAYADATAITSVSFSNLQITPVAGSVVFNPTGANALAGAVNSQGQMSQQMSMALPIAQANAAVAFASASGMANTTTFSANAVSLVTVTGCSCSAESAGQAGLSGTFSIVGGQGVATVNITGLFTRMQSVFTDQFGLFARSDAILNFALDGVPLFSIVSTVLVDGRNLSDSQEAIEQLSRVVSLEFNVPHTISLSVGAGSRGVNEIPEPATGVLLLSGLGFVAGFLRKRRKTGTTT